MHDSRATDLQFQHSRKFASQQPEPAFALCIQQLEAADPAAQATLQHCLRRHPGHQPGWFALGQALRRAGKLPAAAVALAKAPDNASALFTLGLVLDDLKDNAGAIAAYRACTKLRPDLPEAHVNLGLALQQAGQLEAAWQAYGTALSLRPDTFARIAQALPASPRGQLWLNPEKLRRALLEARPATVAKASPVSP